MKHKTLTQRLQSRISKRRNAIRAIDEEILFLKQERKMFRLAESLFAAPLLSDEVRVHLNHSIRDLQKISNGMGEDQRLDKALKNERRPVIVFDFDSFL